MSTAEPTFEELFGFTSPTGETLDSYKVFDPSAILDSLREAWDSAATKTTHAIELSSVINDVPPESMDVAEASEERNRNYESWETASAEAATARDRYAQMWRAAIAVLVDRSYTPVA